MKAIIIQVSLIEPDCISDKRSVRSQSANLRTEFCIPYTKELIAPLVEL